MATPHSFEPYLAKPLSDPSIHYHSYEDFPPDWYKAEFYDQYRHLSGHPEYDHFEYKPLKIHSYHKDGFYYYDDHHQTSFRDETGYEAYIAGHQANSISSSTNLMHH